MVQRPDAHHGGEEVFEPGWEPDVRRVTLVLDIDISVIAMPTDTWALCRLDMLVRSLHHLGIMATPVRIEIAAFPLPADSGFQLSDDQTTAGHPAARGRF